MGVCLSGRKGRGGRLSGGWTVNTCPLRAFGRLPPQGEEESRASSAPYGGGQTAKRSGGGKGV